MKTLKQCGYFHLNGNIKTKKQKITLKMETLKQKRYFPKNMIYHLALRVFPFKWRH